MLNNIKTMKANKGFTIVELLIVIVVIAILAAITIVAYNGIQNRAKTNAGQQAANGIIKKFEAINAIKGAYWGSSPTAGVDGAAINTYANAAPAVSEAVIDTATSVIAATSSSSGATLTSTAANNGKVVAAFACPGGAEVYYYDFTVSSNNQTLVTAGAGC